MNIFENPGYSIQKIAFFLFWICAIIGVIMLISGFGHMIRVIDDTGEGFFDLMSLSLAEALTSGWKAEGYAAKTKILNGLYLLLSSLGAIPLYAFGVLAEDVSSLVTKSRGEQICSMLKEMQSSQGAVKTSQGNTSTYDDAKSSQGSTWKCSCGRIIPNFVSSCSCGKSKYDN